MNFKHVGFFSRIIWKAFWSHPLRQILIALFGGLSISLVWLGWDMHVGIDTFLKKAWSGTGIPFTVVSAGEKTPSQDSLFSRTIQRIPYDVYDALHRSKHNAVIIPWVLEEVQVRDTTLRIGYTDLNNLIRVRPWYVIEPQHAPLYILDGYSQSVREWFTTMGLHFPSSPGVLRYPRHDFHALLDIHDFPGVRSRGLHWIEGRWFGEEQSFRKFAEQFTREYPVAFQSDNPSIARFSSFSNMIQGFVTMTGVGLAVFAYLALAFILFHETRVRRREWAILLATGMPLYQLRVMWIGFGIIWSAILFLFMNMWYWLGRFLFKGLLPDILIRPAIWEGPVITVLSAFFIFLCLIPGYRQLYKRETLLALRAE